MLTIYTTTKKYTIPKCDEEYDYEAVKILLTKGVIKGVSTVHSKEDDEISGKKSTNNVMLVFYIITALFCSWLIYSGLRSYFHPDDFSDLLLTEISGVAVSSPEVHEGSGRGHYNYVRIDLRDYPKLHFVIRSTGYEATSRSDLYRIKPGDSVYLKIETEDYQKRITKEKQLSLSDKTDASDYISVYELMDNQYSYLTLGNYKAANVTDSRYGPFIAFLGLGLLTLIIRDWYKRTKKSGLS